MVVLPVVPIACFGLFPMVHLLLITITVLLVLLTVFLLSLRTDSQIFHLHIGNLFEGHGWLVAIWLPYFAYQLFSLVFSTAVVAFWVMRREEKLLLDFFRFFNVNHLHFWNCSVLQALVLLQGFRVVFDRFFVG